MKIEKSRIGNFEAEFNGMMIHGTVNGVEFSEYLTIKEGKAVVERIDSNIKLNQQDDLEKAFGADWKDENNSADADLFDALEEAAQEAFQALYIEEYGKAITALVPDFDCKNDLEVSGSPWATCDLGYTNASTVSDIQKEAKSAADDHAPEIAENLAEDFENADNMPRIILVDDSTYHIYDVNNCLDVFGRCSDGIDFEAIKTAFDRTKTATSFDSFKKLAQSFESITDLDDLYKKMLVDHPSTLDRYGSWSSDLPNFGGEDLAGNDGVWSWDEKRLIIGEFAGNLEIITREEYAERQQ